MILEGRHAHRAFESPQRMKLVEMCMRSEFVETELLVVALLDQITHASNRTMRDDVPYRASMVDTFTQDHIQKQCLRLLRF